jgi:glycosyltransferase involved in cell wall biosynthesis
VPEVTVGIAAHAEPERLHATLRHLRAWTSSDVDLVLLLDGPDPDVSALVTQLDLPVLGTSDARGAAACFNRLAASTSSNVVVLLESGSLVGPGWLEALLTALATDSRNGLAGPSTNMAWNEQCAFPSMMQDVSAVAREASRRFGGAVRGLEGLHSLADFCYAVKREVIRSVGAADEGYGLGPCWEIDYSTRAACAGFRAVWACSSYVHRLPFTARRQREETQRFEASKHRYQDTFCGLRLRGERAGDIYEPHCRGDACEHFAPPGPVQVFRSLPPAQAAQRQPVVLTPTLPMVSCIMPTRNRAAFVRRALKLFDRQDYPERELIIVDDDGPWANELEADLRHDSRVRYVRAPAGTSIGHKRNLACEIARGAVLAQWDDDDWFGPHRLTSQVQPIVSGQADITGLTTPFFHDQEKNEWWTCSPELHRLLFEGDVHGGTLAFSRHVWADLARYPNRSLAEDALFLRQALSRGARLRRLDGHGLFIYVRHSGNTWRFPCGSYLKPTGWQRVAPPHLSEQDRAFFAASTQPQLQTDMPLVSCIMPTADRRAWVPYAVEYFLRQDYARRELVIVDDGVDAIQDLLPADERIRYVRLPGRQVLGQKRNTCIEHSRGDLIMHWDDDDWMATHRIRTQVELLLQHGAEVSGLRSLLHLELGSETRRTWLYEYPAHLRPWVLGNTLVYSRRFWLQSPFPEVPAGEDARFLFSRPLNHLVVQPANRLDLYVAMVHHNNTSPKACSGPFWSHWSGDIRSVLGADAERYMVPAI